ncbi:MAG: hypothetical protein CL678_16520 [Bdellovibrionaceae bacterium]|nr:hypothetical protein [Pseudobdellovibrionaceae bacterium]|tara:strand:+ start:3345 stop:4172 length:828 start_codon:yes stop_codon:yes gene_type:complete
MRIIQLLTLIHLCLFSAQASSYPRWESFPTDSWVGYCDDQLDILNLAEQEALSYRIQGDFENATNALLNGLREASRIGLPRSPYALNPFTSKTIHRSIQVSETLKRERLSNESIYGYLIAAYGFISDVAYLHDTVFYFPYEATYCFPSPGCISKEYESQIRDQMLEYVQKEISFGLHSLIAERGGRGLPTVAADGKDFLIVMRETLGFAATDLRSVWASGFRCEIRGLRSLKNRIRKYLSHPPLNSEIANLAFIDYVYRRSSELEDRISFSDCHY